MKQIKHHVHLSDFLAIIITTTIAVYSIISNAFALGLLHLIIAFLRLVLIIFQLMIVSKNDDEIKKFKKERIISRVMGIIMLLLYGGIVGAISRHFYSNVGSSFYSKHALNLAIAYGVYTFYKFISAHSNLKRFKKSMSPYRETVARITYIVAFINLIPLTYFVTSLIPFPERFSGLPKLITTIVIISSGAVILFISFGMIISRRLPKEFRNN